MLTNAIGYSAENTNGVRCRPERAAKNELQSYRWIQIILIRNTPIAMCSAKLLKYDGNVFLFQRTRGSF
jgi:hypothetical protein